MNIQSASLVTETIDSALNQTLPFNEIILVDDGSTDTTSSIVEKYGNAIRYIKTKNQGVQAARNRGIAEALSDLVVLCDSDDLLEPEYLACTSPWMQVNTAQDLLYTNFVTFSDRNTYTDKLSGSPIDFLAGASFVDGIAFNIPNLYQRSIEYQPLFTCGLMIRKSFIERIGGYNLDFKGVGAEDWEFTLRAIDKGSVAFCTKPLAKVRKHPGNDSGNVINMALGEVAILEHAIRNHDAAKSCTHQIATSIAKRRHSAFDSAYSQGKLDLASEIGKRLDADRTNISRSFKYAIKRAILKLPKSKARFAWKISQYPWK